jgi:hypothetical protein
MPHSSDPEFDCASSNPKIKEAVAKQCLRPQRNKAAKENHKNLKLKDIAICAQAATTKDLGEASKRKAEILEDQNVFKLFTAPDNGNMSEDFRE